MRDLITVHTLTKDVHNPYVPFLDRRRDYAWIYREVFLAGTRMVVRKSEVLETANVLRVTVSRDFSRHDYMKSRMHEPICTHFEATQPGSDVVDIRPHLIHRDSAELTNKQRKENAAFRALADGLMGALSAPIRDFRSVWFINGDGYESDPDEVLHNLYLHGKVSLEDIEAAMARISTDHLT